MSRLHPILYGALIAVSLSFLGILLVKFELAPSAGPMIVLAMPFLTGFVVTFRFRGPEAFCWTMCLAAPSLLAAVGLVFGVGAIAALFFAWAPLVISATAGVLLGVILRPWLKRWLQRG